MIARLPVRLALFVVLAGGVAAAVVSAQTMNISLGLWNVTASTQMSGAPPFDMSKLTPEQRERAEAAMKNMAAPRPPHTFKSCITAEKLKANPFAEHSDPTCKRSIVERSATAFAFHEECKTDEGTTTSDARFTAKSPTAVTGTVSVVRNANGQQSNITSQITATFVSSACGDVK